MANHIVGEGRRTGKFRPVWFFHGTPQWPGSRLRQSRSPARAPASGDEGGHPLQQPGDPDRLGITHDGEGHITIDVLKELLPRNDLEFYLCGLPPFMQSLYNGLTGIGVPRERIHYESFGSGTAFRIRTHSGVLSFLSAVTVFGTHGRASRFPNCPLKPSSLLTRRGRPHLAQFATTPDCRRVPPPRAANRLPSPPLPRLAPSLTAGGGKGYLRAFARVYFSSPLIHS
ncbi:MAG: hypothetical protein JO358_01450 [Alphaproteobacteria bacterium]|nr:hypothetical protein [Alphaproteobacteria bacterium]